MSRGDRMGVPTVSITNVIVSKFARVNYSNQIYRFHITTYFVSNRNRLHDFNCYLYVI